jgi:hypothetical protein
MTTTPPAYWTPPSRWGPARIIGLVVGVLLLLPAIGLVAGGGVLLWADGPARDDDGYLYSSEESFSGPGYAISTARIDLATGADWLPLSAALGDARAEVTGTDPGQDIFVGIARAGDSAAYLDGVERTVVDDFGTGSAADSERQLGSKAPLAPPGEQDFWAAEANGTGTQTLTWKPAGGNWTLVVMNADASAGVSVDARLGATAPALGGLAWGLLGGGLFLVVVGVLLLVLAIRRPRPGRAYSAGPYVMPSGPEPSWAPPAPVDRNTAADAHTDSPRTGVPPQVPPTG